MSRETALASDQARKLLLPGVPRADCFTCAQSARSSRAPGACAMGDRSQGSGRRDLHPPHMKRIVKLLLFLRLVRVVT
jgi:hypothetical protein